MQSFFTVMLAASMACLATIMLEADQEAQNQLYALEITLEENGEFTRAEQVVVEPGKSYVVALEAGAEYDLAIDIPGSTRAVQDPFASDMPERTGEYLELQTELTIEDPERADLPSDAGKLIAANLLLSMAEPAREIRSIIPVSGLGLLTEGGAPIESLAITVKGTPFRG